MRRLHHSGEALHPRFSDHQEYHHHHPHHIRIIPHLPPHQIRIHLRDRRQTRILCSTKLALRNNNLPSSPNTFSVVSCTSRCPANRSWQLWPAKSAALVWNSRSLYGSGSLCALYGVRHVGTCDAGIFLPAIPLGGLGTILKRPLIPHPRPPVSFCLSQWQLLDRMQTPSRFLIMSCRTKQLTADVFNSRCIMIPTDARAAWDGLKWSHTQAQARCLVTTSNTYRLPST